MLQSVEVHTHQHADDNKTGKVKHSRVELLSKDQRRINIVMVSLEECNTFKEMIRHATFLDNVEPTDR